MSIDAGKGAKGATENVHCFVTFFHRLPLLGSDDEVKPVCGYVGGGERAQVVTSRGPRHWLGPTTEILQTVGEKYKKFALTNII